jgi:hypothetical protein
MQVSYCDLCGNVMKNKKNFLVIITEEDFQITQDPYHRQLPKKSTKEVCDSCVNLINKVFEYKKDHITKIQSWIDEVYAIPSKKVPKKRGKKNGNKKKTS